MKVLSLHFSLLSLMCKFAAAYEAGMPRTYLDCLKDVHARMSGVALLTLISRFSSSALLSAYAIKAL